MKSARGYFWFAALAGVVLVLLHQSLLTAKGLVPADAVLIAAPWNLKLHPSNLLLMDQFCVFVPDQEFVHQQQHFPLWNPYLCCGVPNLGAIQMATLFPIRLLFSWLDPFTASGLGAFLKLCLAGWFTMLYVRLLGVGRAGALLSGMAFCLSGFMIVWLGHPHVNSAIWLPLLFYFIEKTFRDGAGGAAGPRALRAWAGFAIAFACMILGGYPPSMIHIAIAAILYFIFRLREFEPIQMWPRAALLAGAVLVGALLAAPQILPFLEYYRLSSGGLSSASEHRWMSHLTYPTLIHFLLPNILGNPAKGFTDMQKLLGWPDSDTGSGLTFYVGILPLFFAAWAVARRRCRLTWFFCFLAGSSLLVIYGVPPLPEVIGFVPFLRDVNQTRLTLVVVFSLAVLAGLGWDQFERLKGLSRNSSVTAGFCAVAAAALVCFWMVAGPKLPALDAAHRGFLARQFLILACGLIVAVFLDAFPAHWPQWLPAAACLGWTAVDLLAFGMGFNPAIPRDLYYPKTPALEWLQKDKSIFRIFGGGRMLPPNTAEMFGLSDARGCDFMTVRRYEELITGEAGAFFFYAFPRRTPDAFPLLNVKYLLSESRSAPDTSQYETAYSGEIEIQRYKPCLDRALVVYDAEVKSNPAEVLKRVAAPDFDPRKVVLLEEPPVTAKASSGTATNAPASVNIGSYEPDALRIEATLPRSGFLLLLDTWFPGWSATVNGEPAPILRADYNFRAVQLSAGKSTVQFSYRPASLRWGLGLCGIGILAVALAFLPRRTGAVSN